MTLPGDPNDPANDMTPPMLGENRLEDSLKYRGVPMAEEMTLDDMKKLLKNSSLQMKMNPPAPVENWNDGRKEKFWEDWDARLVAHLQKLLTHGITKNSPAVVFSCEFVDQPEGGMYDPLIPRPTAKKPLKESDANAATMTAGADYMVYKYQTEFTPTAPRFKPEDGDAYKIERANRMMTGADGSFQRFEKRDWLCTFNLGAKPTATVAGVGEFEIKTLTVWEVWKVPGRGFPLCEGMGFTARDYEKHGDLIRELYETRDLRGREGKILLKPAVTNAMKTLPSTKTGEGMKYLKDSGKLARAVKNRDKETDTTELKLSETDAREMFGIHRTVRTSNNTTVVIRGATYDECYTNLEAFSKDPLVMKLYDYVLGNAGRPENNGKSILTRRGIAAALGLDYDQGTTIKRIQTILDTMENVSFKVQVDKKIREVYTLFEVIRYDDELGTVEHTLTRWLLDTVRGGRGIRLDERMFLLTDLSQRIYDHYRSKTQLSREREMVLQIPLLTLLADAGVPKDRIEKMRHRLGDPAFLAEFVTRDLAGLEQYCHRDQPAIRLMRRAQLEGDTVESAVVILEGVPLYPRALGSVAPAAS